MRRTQVIITLVIALLVCAWVLLQSNFLLNREAPSESNSVRSTNPGPIVAVQAQAPQPRLGFVATTKQDHAGGLSETLSQAPRPPRLSFTEGEIAQLDRDVRQALGYLRTEKRREEFQNSASNSYETYLKSIEAVQTPYQFPLSRPQVREKVLALHSLALSRYTALNDCMKVLTDVADNFDREEAPVRRGPIGSDLLSVSRICQRLDQESLVSFNQSRLGRRSHSVIAALTSE